MPWPGGVVGVQRTPTLTSASGVWGLNEQFLSQKSSSWPRLSIIQEGLMVHLDASVTSSYPGTGTTWFDISGNGRHASGSASYSSDVGGTFLFNNNEFVGSSSGVTGNTARTLAGWHKLATADRIPFTFGNVSSTGNSAFAYAPNSGFAAIYGLVGQFDESVTTSVNVLDNAWHFSAVTYDAANPGVIRVYVDGQLSGSLTRSSGEAYETDDGYVVGDWGNNDRPLVSNAAVAQFMAYNRALSGAEVLTNFERTRARFGR